MYLKAQKYKGSILQLHYLYLRPKIRRLKQLVHQHSPLKQYALKRVSLEILNFSR
ncbi:hypothetical protein J6590_089534 [Homalodisca vitripennis]|nr:hypothetical protein J6590_089534 [Homalodisca vitripennis]